MCNRPNFRDLDKIAEETVKIEQKRLQDICANIGDEFLPNKYRCLQNYYCSSQVRFIGDSSILYCGKVKKPKENFIIQSSGRNMIEE
jgi:hypothetical protein